MMLISHPETKGYREKPLELHLAKVAEYARLHIQRLSLNLHLIKQEPLSTLAYKIGVMHDLGKATSYFQHYIRGGKHNNLTRHSYVSAVVTYFNILEDKALNSFAPLAFKVVQKHHGNLNSFFNNHLDNNALITETLTIFKNLCQQIEVNVSFKDFLAKNGVTIPKLDYSVLKEFAEAIDLFEPEYDVEDAIELFLIQNLLFSVLTDADKHDAANLPENDDVNIIRGMDYSPHMAISGITSTCGDINHVRDIFLHFVENNPDICSNNKLYSMTAPTGSGKTYACMVFTSKLQETLRKKRRVIYCLPYTSIIDQNYLEFKKVLKLNMDIPSDYEYKYFMKHHHLVDYYKLTKDDPDYDYNDYLNDSLIAGSWDSACVISTFVQLFHSLIGFGNSMVRKLHNVMNSIILLDEIQSLPAKYYPLIRAVFGVLVDRFDTYVLTCTATQPYIYKPNSFVELCANIDFNKPVFNRVKLTIIREPHTIESFCNSILNLDEVTSVLFVLNTKRSAIALYKLILELYQEDYEVFCLTTLHTPIHRQEIISLVSENLKKGNKTILISTQLVEAGVDLSFCRVYRDMGPLDSIIQVAGRCNRHGELGYLRGEMFLLCLHDDRGEYCQKVYDKYLISKTRECLKPYTKIESLQFEDIVSTYYQSIDLGAEGLAILKAITSLNYDQDINHQIPINKFHLIENDYTSESLYILSDELSDKCMQSILDNREALKDPSIDAIKQSRLQLSMARDYHILTAYQLNLSMADCSQYSQDMHFFCKLTDHVYYVRNKYCDMAYKRETGFILEPSNSGGCLSL